MNKPQSAASYGVIDIQSKVGAASPYQLVQLMYEGALKHLRSAQYLLREGDQSAEQKQLVQSKLAKTVDLFAELRSSLDTSVPGELPHNLSMLYEYMQRKLLTARIHYSVEAVDEVISLVETLKSGWDQIEEQVS